MRTRRLEFTYVTLALLLSACISPPGASGGGQQTLTEPQAIQAAWQALEPNTASHDQANWQVETAKLVKGGQVASQFEGEPAPGCMGSQPPPNQPINPAGRYWYLVLRPVPVTPRPWLDTPSPTAPPLIPEPFTREGQFLVDASQGRVVARRLLCVIY